MLLECSLNTYTAVRVHLEYSGCTTNVTWSFHHIERSRNVLIHLSLDKMAAISQTIVSDAYQWMNSFLFWFKFHRALLLRVQLTATQHGLDNDLPPNRRQAIIWNNADPIRWGIYAALGGDELNTCKILDSSRSSTRALYIQIHLWTYMYELKPKMYYISPPPPFSSSSSLSSSSSSRRGYGEGMALYNMSTWFA